jgi:hypothetical protein
MRRVARKMTKRSKAGKWENGKVSEFFRMDGPVELERIIRGVEF